MQDRIDDGYLMSATRVEQLEAMESWFRERFEDPAERTPYESREGGYIWIWGGPHDAEIELRARFEDIVTDETIEKLATSLSGECPQWAPTPQPEDYDAGLYDAVSSNTKARQTLEEALFVITQLISIQLSNELAAALRLLLFANAITAMETYLSDTFINSVFADKMVMQRYIESDLNLRNKKVLLRDLLSEAAKLEDTVRTELLDIVWHNIGKAKTLYSSVLDIDLGDVNEVAVAIQKRHDIVHRNGKSKNGEALSLDNEDITDLMAAIWEIASRVERKHKGRKS